MGMEINKNKKDNIRAHTHTRTVEMQLSNKILNYN